MTKKYWAKKSTDEVLPELMNKIEEYNNYLESSGTMTVLRDSYKTFYSDKTIKDVGEAGQLKAMTINHYGSLARNLNNLITSQRIVFQAVATNSDYESIQQTILANSLLDYYLKHQKLERLFKDATLMASFLKESWISTTWSTQKGNIISVTEDDQPIYEGDLDFSMYDLTNVIRNPAVKDDKHNWLITRELKNKYDLSEQYPEYADRLVSLEIDKLRLEKIRFDEYYKFNDTELCEFYTFYHKPTSSLPNGRLIQFVHDQILIDSTLPYDEIPLSKVSPEQDFQSCFDNSPLLDLLPLQKAIDTLASTLLTNNAATGVQHIWSKKGSGINIQDISSGLQLIESEEPPQTIQLTRSAPESYNFLQILIQNQQTLSSISDVVRGATPSANMSGSSLALLSQQSIQAANQFQASYVSLIEDVGTKAIRTLQRYANTQRVSQIVGKFNKPMLREWSGADLSEVSRVSIEQGSSLSRTPSGRLQIAENLMSNGFIKSPQDYISVLESGRLEPMLESETSQELLIRQENESLMASEMVSALLTDQHSNHILEHAVVLNSPEARRNPELVANVLNHIQQHLDLAQQLAAQPMLAGILKQDLVAQLGQQTSTPQITDNTNPVETQSQEVNMPNMPIIAGTNERIQTNN